MLNINYILISKSINHELSIRILMIPFFQYILQGNNIFFIKDSNNLI